MRAPTPKRIAELMPGHVDEGVGASRHEGAGSEWEGIRVSRDHEAAAINTYDKRAYHVSVRPALRQFIRGASHFLRGNPNDYAASPEHALVLPDVENDDTACSFPPCTANRRVSACSRSGPKSLDSSCRAAHTYSNRSALAAFARSKRLAPHSEKTPTLHRSPH